MSDQSHYEDEEIFSPTASGSEREMSDEIPVILATCTPNPSGGENDRIPRRLFQTCGKRPRSQTREFQFADITNKPDKRSKTADTTQLMILNEIQKANSSINNFAKDFSGRLDAFEKRLASVEQREFPLTPTSTDAGSSAEKVKRKVPTRVRQEIRDVYKTLVDDESGEFSGFDVKKRFTDPENNRVLKKLILEMKSVDPEVPSITIRDAVRRFYQTKVEESSLKEKGKYDDKLKQQRRQNRIKRKLDTRLSVFLKNSSVSSEQKELCNKILTKDFMSSEESGTENVHGVTRHVLVLKPLPWRGAKAERFLHRLDAKASKNKSKQSKTQTLPRVIGSNSSRPKPIHMPEDFWGFTAN